MVSPTGSMGKNIAEMPLAAFFAKAYYYFLDIYRSKILPRKEKKVK